MPIPQVVCSADITKDPGDLPANLTLGASASGAPILQWEWTLLSAPAGSTAGNTGNFSGGVSVMQNPDVTIDLPNGNYVFQARARNVDGWSDPSQNGDWTSAQQVVKARDEIGLVYPGQGQFGWADDLNGTLAEIANQMGVRVLAQAQKPSNQTANFYYGGGGGNTVVKITDLDLTFTPRDGKTLLLNWSIVTNYASATFYTRQILYRIDGGSWQSLGCQYAANTEIFTGNIVISGLSDDEHTIEFGGNTDLNNANFQVLGASTVFGYVVSSSAFILEFHG